MKKLKKFSIQDADIAQSDIFKKNQLKGILGGYDWGETVCTITCRGTDGGNYVFMLPTRHGDCMELAEACGCDMSTSIKCQYCS